MIAASGDGSGAAANTSDVYAAGYGAYVPSGASWTPSDATVVTGSVGGTNRSPWDENGLENTNSYFVAGTSAATQPNPVKLVFAAGQSALKVLWGSVDSYNSLAFSSIVGGADVSVSGTDVANAINAAFAGTCGSPSNFGCTALLSFSINDDNGAATTFGTASFASTGQAFEFALAPVPLPAGGLLLLTALGGLVVARRRKAS